MANVVIEELTKRYPEKNGPGLRAVDGINLAIADGEFMVLVGPSGCGKSTTLRMIAGLEEISSGRIAIDGRTINDVAPKDRDIAMVFQDYALYPHMSVFENLAFGLKMRRFPRAEIEQRVREAAAILGIEELLDRKPKALSGGQRQRVAVGRAIVRKPKVFLFDEPLSNLDAKMRVVMRAEIAKLHARLGATMIYVTHDQVEAMTMGDRICVMKDGAIMQTAEPLELYHRPANLFVAGFIGTPPMNFLHGAIESAASGELRFVEQNTARTPLAIALGSTLSSRVKEFVGRTIVLGLRPEDIHEHDATTTAADRAVVAATIEMAEPMGAETYLHLHTGAHAFIARVRSRDQRAEVGEQFRASFDVAHCHWFDPASGRAIV